MKIVRVSVMHLQFFLTMHCPDKMIYTFSDVVVSCPRLENSCD
jgi:hypothetical protein